MPQDERKAELIAELARTRAQITDCVDSLGRDLDFRTRTRKAFARHPAVWIGVALVLGLFVSRIPFRRKKVAFTRKTAEPAIEKAGIAGLALGALKIVFDLARPALMAWATRRFAERFDPPRKSGYPRD